MKKIIFAVFLFYLLLHVSLCYSATECNSIENSSVCNEMVFNYTYTGGNVEKFTCVWTSSGCIAKSSSGVLCNPHANKDCYGTYPEDNLYWYDDCSIREEIIEDCGEEKHCDSSKQACLDNCVDTDVTNEDESTSVGINYYMKGTVTYEDKVYEDYCDQGYLNEYWCSSRSVPPRPDISSKKCSLDREECIDGRCVKSNQSEKGSSKLKEPDQGQQGQEEQETQNQREEGNLTIQHREQLRVGNATQLKLIIQERQQEMNQEMQNLGEGQKNVYQNQNRVRLAVHALLAMENLTGGIGRNVSQIAREFNNSVQATIRAEEKVQARNWLVRFFIGGDEEAAEDIEQEVNRNRERIQELRRLREECDCDEEIRAMLQEQIQNMEQEQNRLQQLAQNEKANKGLFGWLWK